MNILHTLGLMKRSEHERIVAENDEKAFAAWNKSMTARDEMRIERDGADERFKRAATDLAAQAEEIKTLKIRLHYAEPRAKKWDDSLKRSRDRKAAAADRKRMAGKMGKGNG